MNRRIHILGGGTRTRIDSHLYLGAPGSGRTAVQLANEFARQASSFDVHLSLTRSAKPPAFHEGRGAVLHGIVDTNADVERWIQGVVADSLTRIVVFNAAILDFDVTGFGSESERTSRRFSSTAPLTLSLMPAKKLLSAIRRVRKDIFLVAFKQTTGADPQAQYLAGLNLLKASSANLVLANDSETRLNMIVTPEEASYHATSVRSEALAALVNMTLLRSHLTFTRSTVVAGEPVPWNDARVPNNLRTVVDHCIARGAYRRFRGVTSGHFAVKQRRELRTGQRPLGHPQRTSSQHLGHEIPHCEWRNQAFHAVG